MNNTVKEVITNSGNREYKALLEKSGLMEMAGSRTVHARLADPVYQRLQDIAKKRGVPVCSVLQHALSLESWFFDAYEAGDSVCIERGDSLFRVEFPWK